MHGNYRPTRKELYMATMTIPKKEAEMTMPPENGQRGGHSNATNSKSIGR